MSKFSEVNAEAKQAATASSVTIKQPQVFSVCVEVSGTAPLIQNHFSQKAIEEMLRKHMGLSVQREKKSPSDCIKRATIRNIAGKICIPPTAFKSGILTASAQVKGLKKTQIRTQLFVKGNSVPIKYSSITPRMDMVRTSGMTRTPDVRFRPQFEDWSARMSIEFSELLPVQTVVDLLNRAGGVGVGEWRPEKNGTFGTYAVTRHISDPKEIDEVNADCSVVLEPLVIPDWAMDCEISPEILERIAGSEGGEPASEEAE